MYNAQVTQKKVRHYHEASLNRIITRH